MVYIESPNDGLEMTMPSLFLAGGITGCVPWQLDLIKKIDFLDIAVFNPRRKNFPMHDPSASFKQIKWEYDHLRKASMITFWFCKATLCPIVLYELGAWSVTRKPLTIGIEPGYKRTQDVEIQTQLVRPDIDICRSLDDLAESIVKCYKKNFEWD